jgi:hypothetical protein
MITTMKEFAPVHGKTAFARSETERLNALFPGGLKMKLTRLSAKARTSRSRRRATRSR